MWLQCACEVITNNNIHLYIFAASLRDLTEHGRGKFRNLKIIGPANCGKTFLLAALQIIFKTFSNPANEKYACIGVEGIRTFPRLDISPSDTSPRTHPRVTLPRRTRPRWTFLRTDNSATGRFPNGDFPDRTFPH